MLSLLCTPPPTCYVSRGLGIMSVSLLPLTQLVTHALYVAGIQIYLSYDWTVNNTFLADTYKDI